MHDVRRKVYHVWSYSKQSAARNQELKSETMHFDLLCIYRPSWIVNYTFFSLQYCFML